jgi:hypothetical protein
MALRGLTTATMAALSRLLTRIYDIPLGAEDVHGLGEDVVVDDPHVHVDGEYAHQQDDVPPVVDRPEQLKKTNICTSDLQWSPSYMALLQKVNPSRLAQTTAKTNTSDLLYIFENLRRKT